MAGTDQGLGKSEKPAKPPRKKVVKLGAVLNAASIFAAMIAAGAAAYSAWASARSLEQFRETQLLQRRVEACFEIDRQAAAQLAAVAKLLRDPPNDYFTYSWGYVDVYNDYASCGGGAVERAACEAELGQSGS